MNEFTNERELTQEAILVDRAIEGLATSEEWCEIATLMVSDATVCLRLRAAFMIDATVRQSVENITARVDCIDLPFVQTVHKFQRPLSQKRSNLAAWSGWAVAALIAIVGFIFWQPPVERIVQQETKFVVQTPPTADGAFAHYIDISRAEGRYVDELPAITIEARTATGGNGVEVLYIRRIVERAVVPGHDIFKLATDEHGRPVAIPAANQLRKTGHSL